MGNKCLLYMMAILLAAGCGSRRSASRLAEIDALVAADLYDSAYQEVVKMGHDFGDGTEAQAYYCLLLTQTSLLTGHDLASDSLIDIAAAYYEKHGDDEKLSDAYYYKAQILLKRKDYAQAIVLGKKAYDLGQGIGNDGVQYKTAKLILHINGMNGNYDLQLEYAKRSLGHALKTKKDRWIAYAYNNMNSAYQYQGMIDSAIVYAEKAITYIKHIDEEDLPYILNSIGYAYLTKDPEKAKTYLKESIALKPFSQNLENLAYLYKKEGKEEKAYELWKNALLCEDDVPVDKVLYHILQYNLSHGNLEGACEQLYQLAVIKDSLRIALADRSIQQIQQAYDEKVANDRHEKDVLKWWVAALLLTIVVIFLTGYIWYKKHKAKAALREQQLLIHGYMNEIKQLKWYNDHAELQLSELRQEAERQMADLNERIRRLMAEGSPRLARGKWLYDQIQQNGTTVEWTKEDFRCFIDFYKTVNLASYTKVVKNYAPKTVRNTFFLILYEMGKEDKDVRHIMGISQEAIRSTRFRIQKRVDNSED